MYLFFFSRCSGAEQSRAAARALTREIGGKDNGRTGSIRNHRCPISPPVYPPRYFSCMYIHILHVLGRYIEQVYSLLDTNAGTGLGAIPGRSITTGTVHRSKQIDFPALQSCGRRICRWWAVDSQSIPLYQVHLKKTTLFCSRETIRRGRSISLSAAAHACICRQSPGQ